MRYRYQVERIDNYSSYTLLSLSPQDERISFAPGQYVTIQAVGDGWRTPARCFSIVSSPEEKTLQLAFRPVGEFTHTIASLDVGRDIEVLGPFGEFVLDDEVKPVVLIAGGIGITPFMSMIRQAVYEHSGQRILLLAANRSRAVAPFRGELARIDARNEHISIRCFGVEEHAPSITPAELATVAEAWPDAAYYICGPDGFAKAMQRTLREIGVSEEDIHSEAFSQQTFSKNERPTIKWLVWGSSFGMAGLVGAFALATISHKITQAIHDQPPQSSTAQATTNDDEAAYGGDDESGVTSPRYQTQQQYSQPTTHAYVPPRTAPS